jgi:hypothetical protein
MRRLVIPEKSSWTSVSAHVNVLKRNITSAELLLARSLRDGSSKDGTRKRHRKNLRKHIAMLTCRLVVYVAELEGQT